jgi:hypothetical protein
MRLVLFLAVISIVGCASQPEKSYQPADLTNFVAACRYSDGRPAAQGKIDYLQGLVDEYNEYHKTHPITLEDRRYYGRLKNAIWSMRATCSEKQL